MDEHRWRAFQKRADELATIRRRLDHVLVEGRTLREFARRPQVTVGDVIGRLAEPFSQRLVEQAVNDARYEGYITRQESEIKRRAKSDGQRIPTDLDFRAVRGLRAEAVDVLARFRPATMGQAGRLAGVNPADLTLLAVAIRRRRALQAS